ncbi:MAG: hypothetical protein VYA34_02680 [Myxococcota bacterium]|nr:hypothetical protein [Myxococcota bacterium]
MGTYSIEPETSAIMQFSLKTHSIEIQLASIENRFKADSLTVVANGWVTTFEKTIDIVIIANNNRPILTLKPYCVHRLYHKWVILRHHRSYRENE